MHIGMSLRLNYIIFYTKGSEQHLKNNNAGGCTGEVKKMARQHQGEDMRIYEMTSDMTDSVVT